LSGLTARNAAAANNTGAVTHLPPLILHPFSGGAGPEELLEGSRASLALQGLMESSEDEPVLQRKMLNGRFQEVRMLLFLGKDIFRWLQQCTEQVRGEMGAADSGQFAGQDKASGSRTPDSKIPEPRLNEPRLNEPRLNEQSFAAMLVEDPPAGVKTKLEAWGVTDRRAVFSRAIGIHSMFQEPPAQASLSPMFLRNYHRYADHLYICFLHAQSFQPLEAKRFHWEIFASEEYARLLSEQWEEKV